MAKRKLEIWNLEFEVGVAQRYYSKRDAFFEQCHALTAILSTLLGLTAFFSVISKIPFVAATAALLVAVLSVFDLVIGFSKKAKEYGDLYRRFSELSVKLATLPNNASAEEVRQFDALFKSIEMDEKHRKEGLGAIVFNEEITYRGLDKKYLRKVKIWHYPFCQVCTFPPWNFPDSTAE